MRRPWINPALFAIGIDAKSETPLHRQMFLQMRALILSGRLKPGQRLPSTRTLAGEIGVSRNTVAAAFDQLLAEGAIEARVGAGTFVARSLVSLTEIGGIARDALNHDGGAPVPASRDASQSVTRGIRAFAPGVPALDAFPFALWARLLGRTWRSGREALVTGDEPAGLPELREAIAAHVQVTRGVRCGPDQVFIAAGSQVALALAARTLLDPRDAALIEEPGYPGHRMALADAGIRPLPIPVDEEGFNIARGLAKAPAARLACVTPSHHYPLGYTMTLPRRVALLEWAARANAWIIEDDYDSEFRYHGAPLPALQGLDGRGRVVYLGSFSKSLFPGLRIAFLIVPSAIVPRLHRHVAEDANRPSTTAQAALAAFMTEGHFSTHLGRMRRLYARRQGALLAAAHHLDGLLSLAPDAAGMHLVASLEPALAVRLDDRQAAARAAAAGIATRPLSAFYATRARRQGLLLGYAAVPEDAMDASVRRLARALSDSCDFRPDPRRRKDRRGSRYRPTRRARSPRSSGESGA
jgi:GntR family transcriptional regulator/MocR family aminotransferase